MVGSPGVGVIAPRIGPGLDCQKPVAALVIGDTTAATEKVRVDRCKMVVVAMNIAARRIGLPNLDQRIGLGSPGVVEHAPFNEDALAERFTVRDAIARQVGI